MANQQQEWVCCDACEKWYTFESVGLFIAPAGAWYCVRHDSVALAPQLGRLPIAAATFGSQETNSSSSMSQRSPSASEYHPPRPKCVDTIANAGGGRESSSSRHPPPDENQHQTGHHPVIITPMQRIGKKRVEPNPLRPPSSRKKKRAKRGSDDDSDDVSEEEDNRDDEDWRPR